MKKIWLILFIFVFGFAGGAFAQERKVYLTIDDGPLNGAENIVSVFSQYPVPVTLFMVGMHVEHFKGGQALLSKIKAMPNVSVGDHSYSHAHDHYRFFYSNWQNVVKDMVKGRKVLGLQTPKAKVAATPSRLPGRDVFRLQGLSADDPYITKDEDLKELIDDDKVYAAGFDLYGWDLEWAHYTTGKPVQSVSRLLEEIDEAFTKNELKKPGKLVLLMHDQMFPDAYDGKVNLVALIQGLKQRGYVMDHLRNY